jgi:hypothetical protein
VTRRHAKKKSGVSRGHEIRFLVLLTAGLCVLALGTMVVTISTAKPDISDLSPIFAKAGDYTILNWAELERGPHALKQGTTAFTGALVQALGYLTEPDPPVRAGRSDRGLVLLPDAGNLLHPAHRFGDQMITIYLAAGPPIEFASGSLVWAKGILRASYGDPAGAEPLYELQGATVLRASKEDIKMYFH